MTTINMTQAEIQTLRKRRDGVKTSYAQRDILFQRYEDIYFMKNIETPKDSGVDPNDWKVTASPGGRDKVTGLKRILDTSEIHIKVKDREGEEVHNSDKIEAALKEMLRISGEYRPARIERDSNLSSVLYGPVVLTCNAVDDLLEVKKNYQEKTADKFVYSQLRTIRARTPFLFESINAKESYPVWGRYGLSGHLQEYTLKGYEIKEEWGCDPEKFKDDMDYTVQDFFHYTQRLVESNGVTLFADEWLKVNAAGEFEGVTSIPIFVRYAGGSTLFHKPEEQLQSFLYSYAKGEWDKRENLFWTYLFTAIYTQGLPGPVIIQDPEDDTPIEIDYRGGVKLIRAKGKLENIQVIDGDVLQLKALMENQTSMSTIQEQTIGGAAESSTFSSYVMQVNAGKLPAIDPTEAQEQAYRDLFLHVLQRIKSEGIESQLLMPEDIPADVDLDVTMEPDLSQDDLRNSQIVAQLKQSGANVSDEWLNTNLLKIPDSAAMFRQKTKEEIQKAVVANILQDPNLMRPFIMAALGMPPEPEQPPEQPAGPGGEVPPGYHQMPDGSVMPDSEMPPQGGPGMEAMPMTDAMPQPQERPNGNVRAA